MQWAFLHILHILKIFHIFSFFIFPYYCKTDSRWDPRCSFRFDHDTMIPLIELKKENHSGKEQPVDAVGHFAYFWILYFPIFCKTDSRWDPRCSSRFAHDTMISLTESSSSFWATFTITDWDIDNWELTRSWEILKSVSRTSLIRMSWIRS